MNFNYNTEVTESNCSGMNNYHEPSEIISDSQIAELTKKFEESWSLESAHPESQNQWSNENKSLGQCAVTALIIYDMFGGEIAKNKQFNHLWNILPDGSQQDFSRNQFKGDNVDFTIDEITTKDKELNHEKASDANTVERYELLKQKFSYYWGIAKW